MPRAMSRASSAAILLASIAVAWPDAALSQARRVVARELSGDRSYWTPERVASARPRPLPAARELVSPRTLAEDLAELARLPSRQWGAKRPRAGVRPRRGNFLVDPGLSAGRHRGRVEGRQQGFRSSGELGEVGSDNRGISPFPLDFTSSRLVPEEARLAFPYSTVGLLLFRDGGQSFGCSGAVISARVVLTAGHCVYSQETDTFFTDFLFVPAYHRGEAPFDTWTSDFAAVTSEWADGDGDPVNAADFAVLVMEDRGGMRLGDVTGWLGFSTNDLVPNHLHMLAYPGNHDRGERMHQITSGSWECCFTNTAIYGSDMGEGSSGGPWVQNFGVKAKGQKGGRNKAMNRVVGVTSFGPLDRKEKYQGSSILSASFVSIFNDACARAAGNCSRKGKPQEN